MDFDGSITVYVRLLNTGFMSVNCGKELGCKQVKKERKNDSNNKHQQYQGMGYYPVCDVALKIE